MTKYSPKTKPFPHQARGTIRAVRHRNYALYMEPRLGKSKAALDYVGILALKGEARRVLILAPRIALDVWERELRKHFPYYYEAEDFNEVWASTNDEFLPGQEVVRFFLAGREETFRATRVERKTRRGTPKTELIRSKQDELERWNPDVVIFDESHQYKRPGGRGAQDGWRLVRHLRVKRGDGQPFVLLLSGTPNPKGWRDLFAQFRIMDEKIFGTSVGRFDERYVVYGKGRRRFTILYYKHEDRILKKVRRHSYSVSAEEANLQGVRQWNPIEVEIPQSVMEKYLELADELVTEFDGELVTAKNAGVLRIRLLQLCGGFLSGGKQVHGAKVQAARDWLGLLYAQGEPFVVGARFLPEVHKLAESVPHGCRVEVVEGATRKHRDMAIKDFVRGRRDGLIFQIQSGTAAIDLSRAAELVYYSLPDGWVDFKQFGDRVMGPHQTRPVRYTPILTKGTLERSVIRALQQKEDWHAQLMRSPERFLRGLI